MRFRLALLVLLASGAFAFVAAGCGSSGSPGVANLGPSAGASTTGGGAAPAPGAGTSSAGPGQRLVMKTQDAAKFARCMRSHGVTDFPDPNSQGVLSIGPDSGVDLNSPKVQRAQRACRKVLPNGGQLTPQQTAQMERQALAFSVCMRRHGLHDFPDPSVSGGGVSVHLRRGTDLDPTSPTFQAAQKACQGDLPGRPGQ